MQFLSSDLFYSSAVNCDESNPIEWSSKSTLRCAGHQVSTRTEKPVGSERTYNLQARNLGRHASLLRARHVLQHLLPHGHHQALLLLRVRTHGDRREEAPNGLVVQVDIGSNGVDRRGRLAREVVLWSEGEGRDGAGGGEEGGEIGGEGVEELRVGVLPLNEVLNLGRRSRLLE